MNQKQIADLSYHVLFCLKVTLIFFNWSFFSLVINFQKITKYPANT